MFLGKEEMICMKDVEQEFERCLRDDIVNTCY